MSRFRNKKRSRRSVRPASLAGFGTLHTQTEADQWLSLARQKAEAMPPTCFGNTLMEPIPNSTPSDNHPESSRVQPPTPGNGDGKVQFTKPPGQRPPVWTNRFTQTGLPIPTLPQLLFLPAKEILRFDLGFINLLWATGLPDTPDLDGNAVDFLLNKLGQWANHVKSETERNAHRFQQDRTQFQGSEARWRIAMMITVLQQDFGVRYNPAMIDPETPMTSNERFIHSLLQGKPGCCANMPVLYAAVGRRIGYPIYLCKARRHLFARWQTKDNRERFNIEGSGHGFNSFDDDYYKNWPMPISERESFLGHFLRNLEHYEELAMFMGERAHSFADHGQWYDALVAYSHAHRLAPSDPHYFEWILQVINQEIGEHQKGKLPGSFRELEAFSGKNGGRLTRRMLSDNFQRIAASHFGPELKGPQAKRDQ